MKKISEFKRLGLYKSCKDKRAKTAVSATPIERSIRENGTQKATPNTFVLNFSEEGSDFLLSCPLCGNKLLPYCISLERILFMCSGSRCTFPLSCEDIDVFSCEKTEVTSHVLEIALFLSRLADPRKAPKSIPMPNTDLIGNHSQLTGRNSMGSTPVKESTQIGP